MRGDKLWHEICKIKDSSLKICWVNLLMVEAGCLSSIRCRFDSVTQYQLVWQGHATKLPKLVVSLIGRIAVRLQPKELGSSPAQQANLGILRRLVVCASARRAEGIGSNPIVPAKYRGMV